MYDMLQIQIEKKKIDINTASGFTFDFGIKELANMVGLSPGDSQITGRKLLENRTFQIVNDKLTVKDAKEIAKQNSYYHKMMQLERARQEKKAMT